MSVNLAAKYSPIVDEVLWKEALTLGAVNNIYDWAGVNTVNVYSLPTAPMNNYQRTGENRYGTPDELQNSLQSMTVLQDRAFTYTIDRGNYQESMYTEESGASLARQIREVIMPELDVYRLATFAANAGNSGSGVITKDNAYSLFLDGVTTLSDKKVPLSGRMAFIGPNFYKQIRLDPSFIKWGDMSQQMLINGSVGIIESVPLILVPSSYFTPGVEFIITHPMASPSPVQLTEYKIHDNPPGINGWLIEGRLIYDCFTLNNKKDAIYVHTSQDGEEQTP